MTFLYNITAMKQGTPSYLIIILTVFSISACSRQKQESERKVEATTQITVMDNIIGSLDIGIGWNDASVQEDRWPKHKFSDEDWDRYFELMAWSGCHWLRHAVTISDWEPVNDNNDPFNTDWNGFSFNSVRMQRHYIFLEHAEKHNIKILLANWRLGARWMTTENENWTSAHPDNEEEYAESLAALVYHLKRVKKYQSVWALSLWNEPNGNWGSYTGNKAHYPDSFWPLYKVVLNHLDRLGVQNELLMLGPDTSTGGKPEHISEMLKTYGPILDIIADHDYSAYRGEKMDKSVAAYRQLIFDIEKVLGKKLPFVIGEFGNYGAGAQAVENDSLVYDGALSTTAYLIRMLNNGVNGLARWEFHIYGDAHRNFGALTNSDPNYLFKPYGPVFYPHAIMARYVKPGWKVRQLQNEPKVDGLYATALTSPENDITILLLNDGVDPLSLDLKLKASSHHSVLHHLTVTGPTPDRIVQHSDVLTKIAGVRVTLPPRSITALTSVAVGDLTLPGKLSLKRTE